MDQEGNGNGYVIQFYQYARRYRYNNEGCLNFFNYLLDRREALGIEKYTLESDFLVFGEFDLLQVINVETFREYHDVPELAKDWLGKRQSVLLYDISEPGLPTRICYDEKNRLWKRKGVNGDREDITARFFCFSLISLTNEIVENTGDISGLLKVLRSKILSLTDELNRSKTGELECEVFGTFNPSEVGIVWLSNQYVDVLQVMDFLKHMKVKEDLEDENGDAKEYQAFLTSFSIISIKEKTNFEDVRGKALIQIAMHDIMKDYGQIISFAHEIIGDEEENILESVGEYDLVIEVSAGRAMKLIQNKGLLCVGERDEKTGKFNIVSPKFLYSNTKLLYGEKDTEKIKEKLEELHTDRYFSVAWPKEIKKFSHGFEWEELKRTCTESDDKEEMSNADYFQNVRQKLKESISSSAGAVDTLDLLYADYQSTISSAYSAMWVSDLHRQFKAVLYAISLLLTSGELTWSWNDYRDLTNAFKQQIYHLAQSSKMFLEIPSCHLRATGQYDFLMHAYFGVTKKILEVIYLSQGKDAQSELVPLITVNTVPQVRTQMYFELGEDDRRVVNLDIPNSIIFDFQRGIWYLTHEIFHYAVPQNRETRNYYMAVFLLSLISKKQIFWILRELLSARVDGLVDEKTKNAVGRILKGEEAKGKKAQENIAEIYKLVDDYVRKYILDHFEEIEFYIMRKSKSDDLSNNYQRAIYEFVESEISDHFFEKLFVEVCPPIFTILLKEEELGEPGYMKWIRDRIRYCQRKEAYISEFIKTSAIRRKLNLELRNYIRLTREHIWAAVREACSDIAMVSLNGLDIVDYMLFCIQAWTDENNNKKQILSQMKQESEKKEWIRYALVTEYMRNHSDGATVEREKTEKEFCRRYVWFYAGKIAKKPDRGRDIEASGRFWDKYKEAEEWLSFLSDCRKLVYFIEFSGYYEEILEKLLSDFDIGNRINILDEQGAGKNTEYIRRLKDIQKEFKEKVYLPYLKPYEYIPEDFDSFFQGIGFDHIRKCDIQYNDARFKQDIAVANHFQNQTSLRELGTLNLEIRNKNKEYMILSVKPEISIPDITAYPKEDAPCWRFYARSLTELLFYIQFCFDKLVETSKEDEYIRGQRQNPKIWFRGNSSIEYTHVPIAMRNFKGDKMTYFQSLRDYQQSNFEEFKFRADGALEMSSGQQFTRSDYIAMMQHYGAPTNFLDWTENAYTSLYLALKYHYKHDLKKTDSQYRNVTLSIFNPSIYNHVRQDSMDQIRNDMEAIYKKAEPESGLEKVLGSLGKVMSPDNRYSNLVPNLSIKENEERYDMFLLGDVKTERYLTELKNNSGKLTGAEDEFFRQYSQAYQTDMKALFMPMAVLTSRLNPRIRTQCGCFVAYNLYTPPNPETDKNGKKSLFEYISLEKIQEEKKEESVFMYRIEIDKDCCAEVVRWLRTLGVSRENVYPELSEKGYYFN